MSKINNFLHDQQDFWFAYRYDGHNTTVERTVSPTYRKVILMTDTTSFPAPVEGDTKRSFLARHGLAVLTDKSGGPARGRFGKEGVTLLSLYPDFPFADATPAKAPKAPAAPKAERVVAAPKAPAAPLPTVDPKEVRSWAKQNGVEVAEKGRLNGATVRAYLAAGGKPTVPTAARPTPLDMPVRKEAVGYVVERNSVVALTTCAERQGGGCGKKITHCACDGGPKAAHYLPKGLRGTPLLMVKPVV